MCFIRKVFVFGLVYQCIKIFMKTFGVGNYRSFLFVNHKGISAWRQMKRNNCDRLTDYGIFSNYPLFPSRLRFPKMLLLFSLFILWRISKVLEVESTATEIEEMKCDCPDKTKLTLIEPIRAKSHGSKMICLGCGVG